MLLMVEKELEVEYVIGMQKQIISIWKIMIKTKNHHVFNIWMQTICMDSQCLKNCCFWIEKKNVKI